MIPRHFPYIAASRLGLTAIARRRNAAPILCYHNVVADEFGARTGERSLHLSASAFRAQLQLLRRHYDVIGLAELVSAWESGQSLRGMAAITFDDAYGGVLRHAVPALRELGMPATLFVVSGWATNPRPFWWDVLGEQGVLDAGTRSAAMLQFAGRTSDVIERFCGSVSPRLPDDTLAASWDALRPLIGRLISVGAHSVSHPNLAVLTASEVEHELLESRRHIAERFGEVPRFFAYPYGSESPSVREAVERAGFTAAVSMAPGVVVGGSPRFALPRVNVPASISHAAFECWVAGWRP